MRLLLITPARDEAEHLPAVLASLAAQTRPPDEWVVVDDGSTDATSELLARACAEIPFLRVVQTPAGFTAARRDRLAAAAAPRAFNHGLRAARLRDDFDFVGKLDADTELPPRYFESLLERVAADPGLGIAGGVRHECAGDGTWHVLAIPADHVPGALKLYRRACFEAIGGMEELLGWDAIDETRARMTGWRTRSFDDLVALHHRAWGTADGRLRGRVRYGRSSWAAGQSAWWVVAKSGKVALTMRPRGLSGAAYAWGYAAARARRLPRVQDEAYLRHVRREHRQRALRAARRRPVA